MIQGTAATRSRVNIVGKFNTTGPLPCSGRGWGEFLAVADTEIEPLYVQSRVRCTSNDLKIFSQRNLIREECFLLGRGLKFEVEDETKRFDASGKDRAGRSWANKRSSRTCCIPSMSSSAEELRVLTQDLRVFQRGT